MKVEFDGGESMISYYLFSWVGKDGRKAKVFTDKDAIKNFVKKNNFEDDSILDYGIYVNVLDYEYVVRERDNLKRKIALAINELEK